MLAFESDSGVLWLDGVVDHEVPHMSRNQQTEHFKLYGTLTDVFEDYERVEMLTHHLKLENGFMHSRAGGIRRGGGGLLSWTVYKPELHRMKSQEGINYFAFDSVSDLIADRIGTFFAITPEATFVITPERAVLTQPATIRIIRKLTERYVII